MYPVQGAFDGCQFGFQQSHVEVSSLRLLVLLPTIAVQGSSYAKFGSQVGKVFESANNGSSDGARGAQQAEEGSWIHNASDALEEEFQGQ